jgi:hypothetical protein
MRTRTILGGATCACSLLCAGLLSACVIDQAARRPDLGVPRVAWTEATRTVAESQRTWTADELAQAFDNAHVCEGSARVLHASDPERGWALLSACVRGQVFTDLGALMSAPWIDEVRGQPEGATLLARVIAARGGDVGFDLSLVQRRRLPLFSLAAAVAEPDTYAGRLVVARARAVDARQRGQRRALLLRETHVVAVPERTRAVHGHAWRRESRRGHSTDESQGFVEELRNVSVETGVEVVARADEIDPFLETGNDYIFLLRFDGAARQVRAVEGDVDEAQGIASVLAWFAPQTGRFEYAAR